MNDVKAIAVGGKKKVNNKSNKPNKKKKKRNTKKLLSHCKRLLINTELTKTVKKWKVQWSTDKQTMKQRHDFFCERWEFFA